MAPSANRGGGQSTAAEVSLVHLKSCLVNLPSSLVSLLANVNAIAQNVIVELNYRQPKPSDPSANSNGAPQSKSVFVGWTGMPSKRKLAPIVDRDGISGMRGKKEQEIALVEVDAAFGRMLGLSEGMKVTASLHFDPPLADTINLVPLTPTDWEIVELHATFLELNMIHQVRALPNPNYKPPTGPAPEPYPLTLHLSPTSTANVTVTSVSPPPPSSCPFVKIAPNAEVIVAPKTRQKLTRTSTRGTRSVASTSRQSVGGRSNASHSRRKSFYEDSPRPAMFFRGLDRRRCQEWFDSDEDDHGFRVWVDRELLMTKALHGVKWVCVTVMQPAGLKAPVDPQKQQQEIDSVGDAGKPATKVVARLLAWDDPPDRQHIALSSSLCSSLACQDLVGGVVKVEVAPPQGPQSQGAEQKLKVYPFLSSSARQGDGLKFGGESKAEREETARRIRAMFGSEGQIDPILEGPLTDGFVLGSSEEMGQAWNGGMVRFDPPLGATESGKQPWSWFLGEERKFSIEVQAGVPKPSSLSKNIFSNNALSSPVPNLVGIDSLIEQLHSHLSHLSSVLLGGALGSGKSSIAKLLAHRLQEEQLFHVEYFACSKLVTDEIRVATIRETLGRIFMSAAWGSRLGGKSLVILDDLDKICPAETELEVGGANDRSKQISETVCSIVRQYCGRDSGVVLLATAQGKESVNNVLVGGHIVREIVNIKAPNKESRKRVMEMVVQQNATQPAHEEDDGAIDSHPSTADASGQELENSDWMETASPNRRGSATKNDGFVVDEDLDLLDFAGQTDGYMPGDLVLLVSRARNEALIRSVAAPHASSSSPITLGTQDFEKALQGFTPASLRNVTLQTSTTTFSSIGGLHETRKILLETLQYPTTYAPIFAQCPLRLRSGLLLYGYPGCGKTLLASAVAGECGLNFISVKGPEILNKYIGASEKSVRDLFERAEAARPCVLFFDEFDSIAPKRGHDSTGVTDRVVNQLLTQMDGAEGLSGVYVLAATSRPDLIDPALLRPGRLDKSLICDLPSFEDRVDILQALGKKLKLSEEVLDGPEGGLRELARRTEGYSGADLQALVYNAHLEAIHDVLGDADPSMLSKKNSDGKGGKKGKGEGGGVRDFVQFRYGEEADREEVEKRAVAGHNRSKELAERAEIAQKLDSIKMMKKRAKMARKGLLDGGGEGNGKGGGKGEEEKENTEVVIGWKHMMQSLGQTRASISPEERRRLQRIYGEFVSSRNGEMPNGQGPTEVGGRSSLM